MVKFSQHYDPATKVFRGVILGVQLGRVTRQAHIDDVFQPKQTDEDIEDLYSWEDEEEFTDSDGSGTGNESSMDESESSLDSEVDRHIMASDVDFDSSSSEQEKDEYLNLNAVEKEQQNSLFGFFDQLTKDATAFIKERFDMFKQEPLSSFESCFDIDMMFACCGTSKELQAFGKEGLNK